MRFRRRLAEALVMVGLAGGVAAADDLERVRGEGQAPVVDGLQDAAMHNAIREAMRNAAEVVGRRAAARSAVEDFSLISDRLAPTLADFIDRFEVVSEGIVDNEARVVIDAWVNAEPLREQAAAVWKAMSKPRALVLVITKGGEWNLTSEAEKAVAEYMAFRGIKVIEALPARQSLAREELQALMQGNTEIAVELGRGTGADIVVLVSADIDSPQMFRDILYACEARLHLQILDSGTGQTLTQVWVTERGIEGSAKRAPKKALVSAVKQGIRLSFVPMLKAWESGAPASTMSRVMLSGVTESDAERIENLLQKLKGVRSARLHALEVTTATLKVRFEGDPRSLAENLSALGMQASSLSVSGGDGPIIRAHFQKDLMR